MLENHKLLIGLRMYLLGIDVGSSSVKVAVVNSQTGNVVGENFYPKTEMLIKTTEPGFAEQNPLTWWDNFKIAYFELITTYKIDSKLITAIGVSYQMHGLVVVDSNHKVICDAIIWCDSRAVAIGNKAYLDNRNYCQDNLLASPANLTLSKLVWLKVNKPEIYTKIYKFMLPGDYIIFKLTSEITTSLSGLTEAVLWDYKNNAIAYELLDYFAVDKSLVPQVVSNFTNKINIDSNIAEELHMTNTVLISYRGGDQPNNALGLKVLDAGDVAANAGTSGVVYTATDKPIKFDTRINTLLHVNHCYNNSSATRLGLMLCINGAGILNSWIKNKLFNNHFNYEQMNELEEQVNSGSDGLMITPFGNGAERMLNNIKSATKIVNLDFNLHDKRHLLRAASEGVAYAFRYGIDIFKDMQIPITTIKAGHTNMFLSKVFSHTLAAICNARIELYNTSGAIAAALGAGIGVQEYASFDEALAQIKLVEVIEPDNSLVHKSILEENYAKWQRCI